MHDARRVGGRERLGDVGGDEDRRREGQARPPLTLRDVLALEPLHRDVRLPVVELAERDHLHDARVAEAREHAALAPEARLLACVDARQGDDLEGDRIARDLVVRAVDDPDAPAADLALDDEASGERLAQRGDHGRFPEPTAKISMLTERVPSGRMRRSESY